MASADIMIQAGHEGGFRNSGDGRKPTSGSPGIDVAEIVMTPIVADVATAMLRQAGVSVIREDGFFDEVHNVDLAVALHFDGATAPCSSGASIGYPEGSPPGSNEPAANTWRDLYSEFWPFRSMPDNFTSNLRGYYGYGWTRTSIAELVVEFGEITCPEQNEWIKARLTWLGTLVAHYASVVTGKGDVPKPLPSSDPINIDELLSFLDSLDVSVARAQRNVARVQRNVTRADEQLEMLREFVEKRRA